MLLNLIIMYYTISLCIFYSPSYYECYLEYMFVVYKYINIEFRSVVWNKPINIFFIDNILCLVYYSYIIISIIFDILVLKPR